PYWLVLVSGRLCRILGHIRPSRQRRSHQWLELYAMPTCKPAPHAPGCAPNGGRIGARCDPACCTWAMPKGQHDTVSPVIGPCAATGARWRVAVPTSSVGCLAWPTTTKTLTPPVAC